MGLDMYAFTIAKSEQFPDANSLTNPPEIDKENDPRKDSYKEIMYWRKHPNLHGWMESKWLARCINRPGEWSDFNCVDLGLTEEDIDELEKVVNGGELPKTTGFFFGESVPEDKELDLEFIQKAREAFAEGKLVGYTSWW